MVVLHLKPPLSRKAAPGAIWHEGDVSYRRPGTRNLCRGYSRCRCFPCKSPFAASLGSRMCPRHWRKARKGPFLGSIFKTTFAKQIQRKCNGFVHSAPGHIDKPLLGVSTESKSRPCRDTLAVLCESPAACKDGFPILKAGRAPGMLNTWLIPWEAFCTLLFQQPDRQQQIIWADTSVSPSPCL